MRITADRASITLTISRDELKAHGDVGRAADAQFDGNPPPYDLTGDGAKRVLAAIMSDAAERLTAEHGVAVQSLGD